MQSTNNSLLQLIAELNNDNPLSSKLITTNKIIYLATKLQQDIITKLTKNQPE